MTDAILNFASAPFGRRILRRMGLPAAQKLARAEGCYGDAPLADKRTVVGGADLAVSRVITGLLLRAGASIEPRADEGVELAVFAATGFNSVSQLRSLYAFFHELAPRLTANARVLVISRSPAEAADSQAAAVRRGIEGFVRSLAKELGRRGATANLIYLAEGAEQRLEEPLRFFLSARSAFVTGQPIWVTNEVNQPAVGTHIRPLHGKTAIVTGAARGLGAATAERLSEEGARVIHIDLPADGETLAQAAGRHGGTGLPLDLIDADAPARIAGHVAEHFGGVDILVHNAGIIRDRTIAKMDAARWDSCMAINLEAIVRVDQELDARALLRDQARVVCMSSIAGIAGNVGQTNYATAKSAVIGYVRDRANRLAGRGICVNAVAPGLVETSMMNSMPFLFREIARRMNSLSQAGVPRDVAEVVTFLSTPGACGITGQTIRVCGQHLLGA